MNSLRLRAVQVLTTVAAACTLSMSVSAVARADEPARDGLQLGAGVGLASFDQEGHAPPLCCGERDEWSVIGPRAAGFIGWLPWPYTRLMLQVEGFTGASSDEEPDFGESTQRRITTLGAMAGADLRLPLPIVVPFLGVHAGPTGIWGDFGDSEVSQGVLMLGAHAGAEIPMSEHLAIAISGRYARAFVQHSFGALAALVWTSG